MPESLEKKLDRLEQRTERMERMLTMLVREKNKEKKANEWLPEDEVAQKFGWSARYLRRQAKAGMIPIRTKTTRGRNFQYLKTDVENFIKSKS